MLENEVYGYARSEFLAVSVDLPLMGGVTEASADQPYLCLQIDMDPAELSDLLAHLDHTRMQDEADAVRGIFVGKADAPLLESIVRLAALLDSPKDIPILAPIVIREIYYRLLSGEHGRRIAQVAVPDSRMQRIARVLQAIKTNFTAGLRVEELAAMASMSASSFHHYFKQVTAMSPLQYQKRLRLTEARRIMLAEQADAASAAYRVGYESPSQFSREYARLFGAPPARDVQALRQGAS